MGRGLSLQCRRRHALVLGNVRVLLLQRSVALGGRRRGIVGGVGLLLLLLRGHVLRSGGVREMCFGLRVMWRGRGRRVAGHEMTLFGRW